MPRPRKTPPLPPAVQPMVGDEFARLEELARYHILDTPPEPVFAALTRQAAEVWRTGTGIGSSPS